MDRRKLMIGSAAAIAAVGVGTLRALIPETKMYTLEEALPLLRKGKAMDVEGFDGYIALIGPRIRCINKAGRIPDSELQTEHGYLTVYNQKGEIVPCNFSNDDNGDMLHFQSVVKPGRVYSIHEF